MGWYNRPAAGPGTEQTAGRPPPAACSGFPGFGPGCLATVRRDGGPLIHPINVAIVERRLVAAG
ncbi:MAG: hypothetical protein A2V85_00735 [Chloroflexi bacterium RBG_16_72_14]|nr:MAG: hypothetical protein A2V85_00735 [Chloroflexi bacterium RBG_16_72_14]